MVSVLYHDRNLVVLFQGLPLFDQIILDGFSLGEDGCHVAGSDGGSATENKKIDIVNDFFPDFDKNHAIVAAARFADFADAIRIRHIPGVLGDRKCSITFAEYMRNLLLAFCEIYFIIRLKFLFLIPAGIGSLAGRTL